MLRIHTLIILAMLAAMLGCDSPIWYGDGTGDDDDSAEPFGGALPDVAGITFTIPAGDARGTYEYLDDPFCGEWDLDEHVAWAENGDGLESGISVTFLEIPQPSDHLVASFEIEWWTDSDTASAAASTLCTLDTGTEAWPHTTGVFVCSQMLYESVDGDVFSFEMSGAFRCP